MATSWDYAKTQAAFGALAYQLLAVRDQLKSLSAAIPDTTDEEDEGRVPWTMHGELRGIGEGAVESLDDLIRELQDGASVMPDQLHKRWQAWREEDAQFQRLARQLGLLRE